MVDDDGAGQDGPRFGRYRLDELLGRGGMGEVWRAFDLERRRTVAVKRLHPELANAAEYQERFRREARLAARLRSPHVIPIHDFGEIDGRLFLDMRYVAGRDLAAHLARGRFAPDRALAVLDQVADALAEAHDAGLVHRDVKPSNVLLAGSSDFSYLVDFGIVRALDGSAGTSLTATGVTVGTMLYMAPELLLADRPPDHRADVYALGCTLVEMLTGRPPFDVTAMSALMYHHVNVPPPKPSERGVRGFDDVVARAMAKEPGIRYPSVRELAEDARRALERSEPPQRFPVPRTPDEGSQRKPTTLLPLRGLRRRPGLLAVAVGVVVLAVAVLVAILSSPGSSTAGLGPETRAGFASDIETSGDVRSRSGPTLGADPRALPQGTWSRVCSVEGQVAQGGSGARVSTTWLRVDSAPSFPTYVPLVDVDGIYADGGGRASSIRGC